MVLRLLMQQTTQHCSLVLVQKLLNDGASKLPKTIAELRCIGESHSSRISWCSDAGFPKEDAEGSHWLQACAASYYKQDTRFGHFHCRAKEDKHAGTKKEEGRKSLRQPARVASQPLQRTRFPGRKGGHAMMAATEKARFK